LSETFFSKLNNVWNIRLARLKWNTLYIYVYIYDYVRVIFCIFPNLIFCKRNNTKIIFLIIFYILLLLFTFVSNSNFTKKRRIHVWTHLYNYICLYIYIFFLGLQKKDQRFAFRTKVNFFVYRLCICNSVQRTLERTTSI